MQLTGAQIYKKLSVFIQKWEQIEVSGYACNKMVVALGVNSYLYLRDYFFVHKPKEIDQDYTGLDFIKLKLYNTNIYLEMDTDLAEDKITIEGETYRLIANGLERARDRLK